MSEKSFFYEIDILERHLDTFGHVNNAVYLSLFEEARWDFITKNGYGLKEIQETGLGPVILGVQVKFLKELKVRERIRIESFVSRYRKAVASLDQRIWNSNNEIATEATFTFGLFDLKRRKIIAPTEAWLRALTPPGMDPEVLRRE